MHLLHDCQILFCDLDTVRILKLSWRSGTSLPVLLLTTLKAVKSRSFAANYALNDLGPLTMTGFGSILYIRRLMASS